MPFMPHDEDKLKEGDDTVIWRYLDLAKFLDLIRSNAQWFNCVHEFAKTDPYEGAFPTSQYAMLEEHLRRQGAPVTPERLEGARQYIRSLCEAARRSVYVNCWHINCVESAAMWSQYVKSDGIVVKSTIARFKHSFANAPQAVRIAPIRYVNYNTDPVTYQRCYLYKRESFIHEQELRGFVNSSEIFNKVLTEALSGELSRELLYDPSVKYIPGMSIPTDAKTLIEEVRIAPTAQSFLMPALRDVMNNYGLNTVPLRQTSLTELPT